ncbi:MAG: Smr/MutS family protein [Victivallales bacterium]|nr:Smr/MutS family protein [Victivallales bacterium]
MRYNYDIQLDLHGYRVDEAIAAIERVLYSPHHQSIMVIHGHGTGALKRAIRDFVKRNTYVSEYHFGEDLNIPGGDAVTVIYT